MSTAATQPEPLQLAEWLDFWSQPTAKKAASELRRLHAENEQLRADLEAIGAGGVGPLMRPDSRLPAGWKPVPMEPTEEMFVAFAELFEGRFGGALDDGDISNFHRAMLAAAPQPPASKDPNWPKLEKPARVGGGTFGIGTSSKHVVDAAQRAHDEHVRAGNLTHEQMVEEERKRRALWDMIHGSPEESKPQFVWQAQGEQGGGVLIPSQSLMDQVIREIARYCNTGEMDDAESLLAGLQFSLDPNQQPPTTEKSSVVQPQGEQKPRAWLHIDRLGGEQAFTNEPPPSLKAKCQPLYTHSQNLNCKSTQARLATLWGYVKADQQPQGEQKLMAWMVETDGGRHFIFRMQKPLLQKGDSLTPLYTHPKPRKPLTVEQIDGIIRDLDPSWLDTPTGFEEEFCRAIERAHGIGGEA